MYPQEYPFHRAPSPTAQARSARRSRRVAQLLGSIGYWRWCDPEFADFEEGNGRSRLALDVGCGAGRYLSRLTELGWKAQGIEPSASAAESARAKGFSVQTSTAEEARYPDRTFDLVTMYHSLEHCERPQVAVRQAIGALKPGGVIAIALCNFDSPGRRFFAPAWPFLELPRHRYHFSPRSIGTLLERAGAPVDAVYYHNDLAGVSTALGNMARRAPGRPARSGPGEPPGLTTLLSLAYAPLLRGAGLSMRASFLVRARRH